MHLALVRPVREQPARVKLGFEGKLGIRLEAALVEVERLVELLELVIPSHGRAVAELYRSIPGGVRAPVTAPSSPEADRGNGAAPRPVHALEAFDVLGSSWLGSSWLGSSWGPWETFLEPAPQPSVAELAAPSRVEKRLARHRDRARTSAAAHGGV